LTLDTIGKNLTAKIYPQCNYLPITRRDFIHDRLPIDYISSSCSSCLSNGFIRDNY